MLANIYKNLFKKNKWFYISLIALGAFSLAENYTNDEIEEFKKTLRFENNPLLVLTANTNKERIQVCDLINTKPEFREKILMITNLMDETITELQEGVDVKEALAKADDALTRSNMKGDISTQSKDNTIEITVYKN